MLAVSGMRKNRQLYTPYLLACTGTVCVSCIVAFLARFAGHAAPCAAAPAPP